MDAVLKRIKSYVLILDSTILDDTLLAFTVASVVDRCLSYMNRQQYVAQYELDVMDTTVITVNYVYPIPTELERAIAKSVLDVRKTLTAQKADDVGKAITLISDNGQEIRYSGEVVSFMSSIDTNILSNLNVLLDKYLTASIIRNDNSNFFQRYYLEKILRQDY